MFNSLAFLTSNNFVFNFSSFPKTNIIPAVDLYFLPLIFPLPALIDFSFKATSYRFPKISFNSLRICFVFAFVISEETIKGAFLSNFSILPYFLIIYFSEAVAAIAEANAIFNSFLFIFNMFMN